MVLRRNKLASMGASLRLLGHLEKNMHGNLDTINVTLGCPLHLCTVEMLEPAVLSQLSHQHQLLVTQLVFYAINWVREIINAFSNVM